VRLYVAGPMTGLPDHNYPAFRAATAQLAARDHDVVDPSRLGQVPGWQWRDYMRRGLTDLVTCYGVALLPGWEHSRGAQVEAYVADAIGAETRTLAAWLAE
jgi:uncharacterized protein DUF4406